MILHGITPFTQGGRVMKKKVSKAEDSAKKIVQEKIESLLRQFFGLRGVSITSKGIIFPEPSDFEYASICAKADKLIKRLKLLPGGREAYDDLVPGYLRGELDTKGWPQQVRKLTRAQKKRLAMITAVFDQCRPGKTVVCITENREKPYFALFARLGVAEEVYSDGPYTPDLLSLVTGHHRHRSHVLSAMEIRAVRIIPAERVTSLLQLAGKILGRKLPLSGGALGHDNLTRLVGFLNDLAGVRPGYKP
jgi:hypothetical protein